jgi:hypothetical protein
VASNKQRGRPLDCLEQDGQNDIKIGDGLSEGSSKDKNSLENDDDANLDDDGNIVYVCGLIINIESITKAQILKLRKLMPRKDYRQLKNRKSARECRRKRKAERSDMLTELESLRKDKIFLEKEVQLLRQKLKQKYDQ